jgi:predicted amidohydrolase
MCYDLRFPDLFRLYFHERTPIVFLPAQWPYPRIEHWRLQLRARAVENQYFIAAVNAASRPDDDRLHGFSAIFDPWAEPVAELGQGEQVVVAEVDLDLCKEIEERLPLRNDLHEMFRLDED